MPADVDVSQYSLSVELFEERFARFADSKAAICMDKAITYGEAIRPSAIVNRDGLLVHQHRNLGKRYGQPDRGAVRPLVMNCAMAPEYSFMP